ncbi:hypothetical protein HZF02_15410 [Pseudomonas yamanorum]|nr:hypothetical protein HZF02_15410 [Pseudomonas yamanorum]
MQKAVKLRNPVRRETTEGQWVIFQRDQGLSIDQIVENVDREIGGYGIKGSQTRLIVEYQLGLQPFESIEHLLTPHLPSKIALLQPVGEEGYLCLTSGTEEETFHVLLRTPGLNEDQVRALIADHEQEICFLAFKNAHEGYPFGYALPGDPPSASRVAEAGVSFADIRHLIP